MQKENKIATSATEALSVLWKFKIFLKWQNFKNITDSLTKRGYNFTNAELGMALKRAKYLTKRGSRGSYEYIQKYPFIDKGRTKK